MPGTRVIIVNYNAGESLLACVESALASPAAASVVVADNASEDGSIAALQSIFGGDPRLAIRRNAENLGFARAVNRAAHDAAEPYLLILNPDCVLRPGATEALIDALEKDSVAAVAGPWVTDASGRMQKGTWRRFPDPWRALMTFTRLDRLPGRAPALEGVNRPGSAPPSAITPVEAVSGACMLLRRAAAESVGFFDEEYAMHCEDLDLMYRLAQRGFHCLLVPQAKAVHRGGVSSATRPWWVHRQKHIGMQRYFRKFGAGEYPAPVRWLVYAGIWGHYLFTLPAVVFKRFAGPA